MSDHRKLHGSLLLSTTILFMGIALFLVLISLVPQFKTKVRRHFIGSRWLVLRDRRSVLPEGLCFLKGSK